MSDKRPVVFLTEILATLWSIVLACFLLFPGSAAAQDSAFVRGIVRTAKGVPVAGAAVTVAPKQGDPADWKRYVITNQSGAYGVWVQPSREPYSISITSPGYNDVRLDVPTAAHGPASGLQLDIALAPSTVLRAVQVRARRRPSPFEALQGDVGGAEQTLRPGAALSPGERGDVISATASVPGVVATSGADGSQSGFSVLGLSSDQNSVTLNGLEFSGRDLPRGSFVMSRLTTSEYDVSRGGFSGAQLTLVTLPGRNYRSRSLGLLMTPAVGAMRPNTDSPLSLPEANVQGSGFLSGPLVLDKAFYSISAQAGVRSSTLPSLTSPAGDGVANQVNDATIAELSAAASRLGVAVGGGPSQTRTANAGLLARFDLQQNPSSRFSVTVSGSGASTSGVSIPISLSTADAFGIRRAAAALQLNATQYFGDGYFNDLRMGVSVTARSPQSTHHSPTGLVQLASPYRDADSVNVIAEFGAPTPPVPTQSLATWQLTDATSWYSASAAHELKTTADLRFDAAHVAGGSDGGIYIYPSLSLLEANAPSAFTRSITGSSASVHEIAVSSSIGDLWRISPRLEVQYGIRLEGSAFPKVGHTDSTAGAAFHIRTGWLPATIAVSPRIGFAWEYGNKRTEGIPAPRGRFHGGIGDFRGHSNALYFGRLLAANGTERRTCVGAAVIPEPVWTTSAPAVGCDGVPMENQALSAGLRDLVAAGPGFRPPRSLRSNLGWSSQLFGVQLGVEGIVSLATHQASEIDANAPRTVQFGLLSEGNRPVYVPSTGIVPTTGLTAPGVARADQAFGRVRLQVADGEVFTKQLGLTVTPKPSGEFFPTRTWSISYAYVRANERSNGFTGTTAGNPFARDWAPSSTAPQHQFAVSAAWQPRRRVSFNAYARVNSGVPYTPIISGDVNGDGITSNDRAYVFTGAGTDSGTAEASAAIHRLLVGAPAPARACLARQLGRIAGPNSCMGPWSTVSYASIAFHGVFIRGGRDNLTFTVTNALALIDAAVHGGRSVGWAGGLPPDPTLLRVQSFDPQRRAYVYTVNPRFGRAAPLVVGRPVTLTVEYTLDISPSPDLQEVEQQLAPGRSRPGPRLSAVAIAQRYERLYPDPLSDLLAADSMFWSASQRERLRELDRNYRARTDSIWIALGTYLAAQDTKFDPRAVVSHVGPARNAVIDSLITVARSVHSLLTLDQIAQIGGRTASLLDERTLRTLQQDQITVAAGF